MPMRLLLAALLCAAPLAAGSDFAACFEDATLRVDFVHVGHAGEEHLVLERLWRQGPWAGSRVNLVDPSPLGAYELLARDRESGRVLCSRRWDGIFHEYKTTPPGREGVRRAIRGSVLLPFPRAPLTLEFGVRDRLTGRRRELLALPLDPADPSIFRGTPDAAEVIEVHTPAAPENACDILVLAEGYASAEREKFRSDLARLCAALLAEQPFAGLRWCVNLRGVYTPSAQSGVTDPAKGIYRRTALGAAFGALGMERYLLSEENRAIQDLAAHAPYDALIILVNSDALGGGGMYGVYAIASAGSKRAPRLLLHELGHCLAGLADEYDGAPVTYGDYFPPGIEPLEPNVTALLDPLQLKWAHLASPAAPIPTPWRRAAGEDPRAWTARLEPFARPGFVGAFEGAGYLSAGLFRPALACTMRTLDGPGFCPVCREALAARIRLLAE